MLYCAFSRKCYFFKERDEMENEKKVENKDEVRIRKFCFVAQRFFFLSANSFAKISIKLVCEMVSFAFFASIML